MTPELEAPPRPPPAAEPKALPSSLLERAVCQLGLTLHQVKKYEQRGGVFEVTDKAGFMRTVELEPEE